MDTTEQPVQGSDADIVSRLTALDAPAPEAEQTPEPEQPAETEATETDIPEESATEADAFDFTADDGEVVRVPTKLKDALTRTEDYTRKAQEVAVLRQQAEDRHAFVEARDKLGQEVHQEAAELRSIQMQLEQFKGVNWYQLASQDQAQAWALKQQYDTLKERAGQLQGTIQHKATAIANAAREHADKQWQLAEQGGYQRIGKVTQADQDAMRQQIKALGFTADELKTRFADPRFIHLLHKAAQHDALQQRKPGALKAISAAPPVMKSGASKGANAAAENKYREARQALRKSGKVEDAAKLFLMRG